MAWSGSFLVESAGIKEMNFSRFLLSTEVKERLTNARVGTCAIKTRGIRLIAESAVAVV